MRAATMTLCGRVADRWRVKPVLTLTDIQMAVNKHPGSGVMVTLAAANAYYVLSGGGTAGAVYDASADA